MVAVENPIQQAKDTMHTPPIRPAAFLVALLATTAMATSASSAQAACSMAGSQPDSGTLTLKYLGPSGPKNKDRNNYRLSGTVRWNSAAALKCFGTSANGKRKWSYENDLKYQQHFDRNGRTPFFGPLAVRAGG